MLVIDIGSSSTRTALFDMQGNPLPHTFRTQQYQFETTADGASTIDARQLRHWVEVCVDGTLRQSADTTIHAVGLSTFVGNLIGLDAKGEPQTPVFTYADTRLHTGFSQTLHAAGGSQTITQRTGCLPHPAYAPARLHWLKHELPELYGRVSKWVDFATYLYLCWFGEMRTSYSIASWLGLLHRKQLAWDDIWLHSLELSASSFPELAEYSQTITRFSIDYAKRWPCLRHAQFFLAVGDGAAATVGSGVTETAQVALTIGTTSAMRRISRIQPTVPEGLWSYRITRDVHLTGGAMSEGGNVFDWVRRVLVLPDDQEIERLLQEGATKRHGLTLLPTLAGERSPGYNPHITGAVSGLSLNTSAIDIIQAALEGIALRLDTIAELLVQPDDIIIAGGGLIENSHAFTQMVASALDHPLHSMNRTETTAHGIAALVLHALTGKPLSTWKPETVSVIRPNTQQVSYLREAKDRQTALYNYLSRTTPR